jgi:hypothetical protein
MKGLRTRPINQILREKAESGPDLNECSEGKLQSREGEYCHGSAEKGGIGRRVGKIKWKYLQRQLWWNVISESKCSASNLVC